MGIDHDHMSFEGLTQAVRLELELELGCMQQEKIGGFSVCVFSFCSNPVYVTAMIQDSCAADVLR